MLKSRQRSPITAAMSIRRLNVEKHRGPAGCESSPILSVRHLPAPADALHVIDDALERTACAAADVHVVYSR